MRLKALVRGEQGTPKSRVMSVTQEGVQAAVLTHHSQRASLQFSHTQGAEHPLCMIGGARTQTLPWGGRSCPSDVPGCVKALDRASQMFRQQRVACLELHRSSAPRCQHEPEWAPTCQTPMHG